jgi:hypothetical protein
MRVEVSTEAAEFVRERGGQLWVWAARPRMCCQGVPAYMHAATVAPARLSGFSAVRSAGLDLWFRAPAGRLPAVLEVGLRGRRHPRVEAYWEGCLYVLLALCFRGRSVLDGDKGVNSDSFSSAEHGFAVHERGPDGLLAVVRVYDAIEAPVREATSVGGDSLG